jgi:Secretion system C-terminal sorting domain
MKTFKLLFLILTIFFLYSNLQAQDIRVEAPVRFLYEPVGTTEMVIDFEVINVSQQVQTVFEVRTINDVPTNWTSSMCFGILCFAPFIDSVATTPDFVTDPPQPGDTVATSVHVFTDTVSTGTAHIRIEVGTFHNPSMRDTLDFYFTNDPTVDVKKENVPTGYFLEQNYPNPFNPSTSINYGLKEGGFVSLKVYNILGAEVATLVDEFKPAGDYIANFDASQLASGIYIYSLKTNNFVQTRKMILEK